MKFICNEPITHDRKYEPGDEIEMTQAEAKEKLALGYLTPVVAKTAEKK